MGYLCPVCEEPFGGAASLTDHLAVSAILHGEDHETWLVDTVDDWDSIPRTELADTLAGRAAETDDDHEHPGEAHAGHDHRMGHPKRPSPERPGPEADRLDADATAILREAQALTQAMQAGTGAGEMADGGENDTVDDGQNDTSNGGKKDTPSGGQNDTPSGSEDDTAEGIPDSDGDDERKES
jgi:hypothetical protein